MPTGCSKQGEHAMIVSITRLVSLPNGLKNREHGQKCSVCGAESWPTFPGSNKMVGLPYVCWEGHPAIKDKPVKKIEIDTHYEIDEFEF